MVVLFCLNGRCYCHFGRCFICYSILQLLYWLMLLPCGRWNHHLLLYCIIVLADVIAMWQMEKPLHWCFIYLMADVIATAGCECFPPGRCHSQGADGRVIFILISVLRCYAEPHPIYEADGTCLCSCLGMDCLP